MSDDPEILIALDGTRWERVRMGDGPRDNALPDICHDCGAKVGEVHHLGCDWERCPRCGGQFITCDCDDDEIPRYSPDEARAVAALLLAAADGEWPAPSVVNAWPNADREAFGIRNECPWAP